MIPHGLNRLPPDPRDFKLGEIINLPELSTLPETFSLGVPTILNQLEDGNNDYCSAYSTCGGAKFEDNVDFYPPFVFAASKDETKDPESFGQNMRDILSAWCDYGCAPLVSIPDSVKHLTQDQRRYFSNYPDDLKRTAQTYLKKTFFTVTGQYDLYDNIRATLYYYSQQNKKQPIYLGLTWHWDLSQYILDIVSDSGTGHMMYIIGWDKDGLEIVNSAGIEAGKNGEHRIEREAVNYYGSEYGCMTLVDMSPAEAQDAIKKKQQLYSLWIKLLEKLKLYLWEITR